mgnify:CR=1 FL=1
MPSIISADEATPATGNQHVGSEGVRVGLRIELTGIGIGVSQQILTVPKHGFKSEPWHERFGSSMAGAFYHVMARGNRRERIFRDEADRLLFYQTLGEACESEQAGGCTHGC